MLLNKDCFYKCTDTTLNYFSYRDELLNKAMSIFEFENLPETIDPDSLNFFRLINGHVGFFMLNDNLYCSWGTLGGELNINREWTKYIITNPALQKSYEFKIDDECVVMYNSPIQKFSLHSNFYDITRRTAGILSDNLSSINCMQINSRVQSIVSVDNSNLAVSAEIALKDKYNGKPYRVLTNNLANTIKVDDTAHNSITDIKDLINLNNYMYAQFLHTIGISSLEVQKPEHILSAESTDDFEECQINLDIMLKSIKSALDKINKKWGFNIKVKTPYKKEREEKENKENVFTEEIKKDVSESDR